MLYSIVWIQWFVDTGRSCLSCLARNAAVFVIVQEPTHTTRTDAARSQGLSRMIDVQQYFSSTTHAPVNQHTAWPHVSWHFCGFWSAARSVWDWQNRYPASAHYGPCFGAKMPRCRRLTVGILHVIDCLESCLCEVEVKKLHDDERHHQLDRDSNTAGTFAFIEETVE